LWGEELKALLERARPRKALVLCHHNADPDAACSALALAELLEALVPGVAVKCFAAQGVSKVSKRVLEYLGFSFSDHADPGWADVLFMVDTNNTEQLEELKEAVEARAAEVPLVVIDHHARHPSTERLAALYLVDDKASSTCELILRLYEDLGLELSPRAAKALFLGIAYDTRHLVFAGADTFLAVAKLVRAGARPRELFPLLSTEMDYSERVARLKACMRARVYKFGEWLVALSHVSAFQASAARALLSLGAHLAIVAGEREGRLRVSMRATEEFASRTGVHLGRDLARPLGELINGMGGGHALSAGANGEGSVEEAIEACLALLVKRLGVKGKELK